jgi:hypothetical protein
MNCQRIQDNFSDYQDGLLSAAEAAGHRTHLATCPACQREWSAWQQFSGQLDTLSETPAPSPRLREQFYAMLETHESAAATPSPFALARSRLDPFFAALFPRQPALQFAFALALLCGGVFAGRQFMAPPAADQTAKQDLSSEASAKEELAALRSQINSMGQLVTYSLLQQQSTSERLRAVLATMEIKNPDRKILTDLVGTLVFDPSINVRLSAVDALAEHTDDALVRAGVITALPRETAPLVQLAMIELLATAGDPSAKPVFEKLLGDETLDDNVRDAAQHALMTLLQPAQPEETPSANHDPVPQPTLT